MRVIQGANNVDTILKAYGTVIRAPEVKIRNQDCRNVPNMALILNPAMPVLTTFNARKMNLTYAKREWLWYLSADRYDDSIEQYATVWAKLKQPDGGFNSNYGQYIFAPVTEHLETDAGPSVPPPSQFDYVVQELTRDTFSRRASIVLLQPWHLREGNSDVVCTYAINFSIVPGTDGGGSLDMTVMMRSNDIVYGFTNDGFCFWQLYLFMYTCLQAVYGWLRMGTYTHFTNSMHVYEKHYKMLREIVTSPSGHGDYRREQVPKPTLDEVLSLLESRGKLGVGAYSKWLMEEPAYESPEQ